MKQITSRLTSAINRIADAEAALVDGDADEQKLRKTLKMRQNAMYFELCQIAGQDVFDTLNAALTERGMSTCQAIQITTPNLVGIVGNKRPLYDIERAQMTQLEMVHEVRINQNYKYDEDGDDGSINPATKKYKRIIQSAFWISLPDDLRLNPPVYKNTITVFKELRDIVNHMQAVVSNFTGTTKISNVLGIDRICDKTNNGAMEWTSCVEIINTVETILNKCHSAFDTPTSVVQPQLEQEDMEVMGTKTPSENPEWNLLQERMQKAFDDVDTQPEVFRDGLKFLMESAKKNAISTSNSNLRLVATKSLHDGITYEKNQFDQDCKSQKLSLKNVRDFVKKAVVNAVNKTKRILLTNLVNKNEFREVSFVNVIDSAFVSLLTQTAYISTETCPETLLLDIHRIMKMQEAYGKMITICSIGILMQEPPYNHKVSTAWVSSIINELMMLNMYGDSHSTENKILIMGIVQQK